MNRLIIIGNGFDLAHKLKTSYNDFIEYLCKDVINAGYNFPKLLYKSNLGVFKFNRNNSYEIDTSQSNYQNMLRVCDEIHFNNSFIKLICETNNKNWVDIEMEYYKLLSKLATYNNNNIDKDIDNLNNNFLNLQNLFIEYLQKTIDNSKVKPIDEIKTIFTSPIFGNYHKPAKRPRQSYFVNFNYTNTLNLYNVPKYNLINIHGQLSNDHDDIIFGFGDELAENYKDFENLNQNNIFRFIKSFGYLKNDNYSRLSNIIDSAPFEVMVLGHSCGLSDRTLLNYIFESKNCEAIKIYYYNTKANYIYTINNISRHFKNKTDMRKKIIDFKNSSPMPQMRS